MGDRKPELQNGEETLLQETWSLVPHSSNVNNETRITAKCHLCEQHEPQGVPPPQLSLSLEIPLSGRIRKGHTPCAAPTPLKRRRKPRFRKDSCRSPVWMPKSARQRPAGPGDSFLGAPRITSEDINECHSLSPTAPQI